MAYCRVDFGILCCNNHKCYVLEITCVPVEMGKQKDVKVFMYFMK